MATVEVQDQINIEADIHRDGHGSDDDNGDTTGTPQVTRGATGGAA
jgi:hypothetical protein